MIDPRQRTRSRTPRPRGFLRDRDLSVCNYNVLNTMNPEVPVYASTRKRQHVLRHVAREEKAQAQAQAAEERRGRQSRQRTHAEVAERRGGRRSRRRRRRRSRRGQRDEYELEAEAEAEMEQQQQQQQQKQQIHGQRRPLRRSHAIVFERSASPSPSPSPAPPQTNAAQPNVNADLELQQQPQEQQDDAALAAFADDMVDFSRFFGNAIQISEEEEHAFRAELAEFH